MKLAWSALAAVLLMAASANAALIEKKPNSAGHFDLITISGPINLNDDEAFRQIAALAGKAIVVLNSEGGSVVAALEIGRAIRLKGFATAVLPNTLCASACALAWLAGSPRFLSTTSHIGFHASYVVSGGKASASGVGNALVGAYLNQIGLSQRAIVYVTSAPPKGMEWLSPQTAGQIGVSFTSLDQASSHSAPVEPEGPPTRYDPLGTVTAFYNALSAADGDAAAALVIPEKRGIGPFNEASIHSFFGGLAVPLQLTSVAMTADGEVEASYDYVRAGGEICKGKSIVRTVRRFGKTLISKIRALNGC